MDEHSHSSRLSRQSGHQTRNSRSDRIASNAAASATSTTLAPATTAAAITPRPSHAASRASWRNAHSLMVASPDADHPPAASIFTSIIIGHLPFNGVSGNPVGFNRQSYYLTDVQWYGLACV